MLDSGEPNQPIESVSTPEQGVEIEYLFPFDWGTIQMTEGFLEATGLVPLAIPAKSEEEAATQWSETNRSGLPVVNVILVSAQELVELNPESQVAEDDLVHSTFVLHRQGVDVLIGADKSTKEFLVTTGIEEAIGSLQAMLGIDSESALAHFSDHMDQSLEEFVEHNSLPNAMTDYFSDLIDRLVSQAAWGWQEKKVDKRYKQSVLGAGVLALASSNALTFIGAYKRGLEAIQPIAAFTSYAAGWFMYCLKGLARRRDKEEDDSMEISDYFAKWTKDSFMAIFSREKFEENILQRQAN